MCIHKHFLLRQERKESLSLSVCLSRSGQVPSLEGDRKIGEEADNQTPGFSGPKAGIQGCPERFIRISAAWSFSHVTAK